MTLPANDAFTLGLAHDDTSRRPHQSRSRSLPRSPSPKISFSSSKSTITTTHTSRVERGLARRASRHAASDQHKDDSEPVGDLLPNSLTKAVQRPLQEIEERREDSPTPSPATPIRKVDWEIPRKILHSSIGTTAIISHLQPQLTHITSRISHFVLVPFKRITQTSRCRSWNCTHCYNCTSRCNPSTLSAI
jgi:diacylglycerol kinase (CTP)